MVGDFYTSKNYYTSLKYQLVLLFKFVPGIFLLIALTPAIAQIPEKTTNFKRVNGMVVTAENDEFLVGVHIYAKVMHVGQVSDQKGMFEMVVDANDTLIITSIGYDRQFIPVSIFNESQIDMVIRMESKVIELDGVTIFAEPNIDYLKRKDRNPLKIHGLQAPAEKPDVDVPVGSLNYGILSRWGKEAKEKRKLMDVYQDSKRDRVYIQTVSSDSVRNIFMYRYGINEKEYNDFVIFLNTYNPLMDRQNPKDIVRVMHHTFLKYRPRKE